MIKYFFSILILVTALSSNLSAQGFDWQYSSRLPSKSPVFFAGVFGQYSSSTHFGNIDFFEKKALCLTFKDGNSSGYKIGLYTEYWYKGNLAFNSALNYNSSPAVFKAKTKYPRPEYEVVYENEFNACIDYISLNIGSKYRLGNSHIWVGAQLNFDFLLNSEYKQYERIVSPKEEPPFPTDPPSYKRTITNGYVAPPNKFAFYPSIKLGYDAEIMRGAYASPYFGIDVPMSDLISKGQWQKYSFSIGINILFGLN